MLDIPYHEAVPARSDFARILIVDRGDVETALAKPVVLHQCPAHPPCSDEYHAVAALEPQDVADSPREFGDGVAEAAFAEGAEEREVFANLGGRGAAQASQLAGGDRGRFCLLEKSEEDAHPSDGAV